MADKWAKWAKTRRMGMVKFVLLYGVLFYSTCVLILTWTIASLFGEGGMLAEHIVRAIILGLLFSVLYWLYTESKYKKYLNTR